MNIWILIIKMSYCQLAFSFIGNNYKHSLWFVKSVWFSFNITIFFHINIGRPIMIVVCISFYIIIYLVLSPGIFNLRMVRFEVPNIQNLVFITFLCYVLLVAGKLDVFFKKKRLGWFSWGKIPRNTIYKEEANKSLNNLQY